MTLPLFYAPHSDENIHVGGLALLERTSSIASYAAVPSLSHVDRDAFGNLRHDEEDSDLASSDRFTVVLEAIDYDYDYDNGNGDDATLGGVYGSAGSGGTVVTGKLEFDSESGVFVSEYVPFVAGTHLLNVTLQVRISDLCHRLR